MDQSDFWTDYAKAMELSVEGNSLIAHELAQVIRRLWRRMARPLGALRQGLGRHPHLPLH